MHNFEIETLETMREAKHAHHLIYTATRVAVFYIELKNVSSIVIEKFL